MNNGDIEHKARDEKRQEKEIRDKWEWEEELSHKESQWRTRKPVEDPKVTISAFTETGREESSIVVPLQCIYMGRKPVIPSILAGTPCTTLGAQGLLDHLNSTLGTSYSLDNPFLASILVECMTNEYDVGMAYGCLRRIWYIDDWSTVRDVLWRWSGEDQKERQEALIGNRIVNTDLQPWRMWDLYSNQVVPYWLMPLCCWPKLISHAWVDKKDRTAVWMPINYYAWPVPIPKNADLNLIHIEMLILGHEHVWLDVLCLRQEGRLWEDLHAEEWRVDVPTIRHVYDEQCVVWYLSRLGRPLMLNDSNLESDQSWFRHAWMLQEVGLERVIAGDTPDGPLHAKCKTELLTRFHEKLRHTDDSEWLYDALAEMRTWVSTNPVDKIAGLAFVTYSQWIPAYSESASLEHAWMALLDSMDGFSQVQLFFLCAELGDAGPKWRPSWHQITAAHTYPIPEDTYTLICDEFDDLNEVLNVCIVGQSLPEGRFEKVSLVETFGWNF
ncbi:hypothetical protein IW261DRAFT_1625475 [Armillaria novae-zelandiae]|uniref:Heterokaryon incompatibility domain-containing protein n=1 Tax=Armillaria novae-zelandiae TaxID=153914 RepID=A0AA39P9L7_9AGAR|nr:hypothetical protein IW261DRAFT_1625475 [Armillaria novae-zelandiae]